MNIEKINAALEEDEMNSGLGIIVGELEEEGYKVIVNDKEVSAEKIFDGDFEELEEMQELIITVEKAPDEKKKYKITFIDFHEIEAEQINY